MSSKYSCQYSTLADYNGPESAQQQQSSGFPNMRVQTIPVWGGIGYEALTHDGRCSCGGHFQLVDAYYDAAANNCPKYAQRACDENIKS